MSFCPKGVCLLCALLQVSPILNLCSLFTSSPCPEHPPHPNSPTASPILNVIFFHSEKAHLLSPHSLLKEKQNRLTQNDGYLPRRRQIISLQDIFFSRLTAVRDLICNLQGFIRGREGRLRQSRSSLSTCCCRDHEENRTVRKAHGDL